MPRFQTVIRKARFVYSPYTPTEMNGFAQVLADWNDDDRRALGATLQRLNEAIARHGSGSQKGMPRAMGRES